MCNIIRARRRLKSEWPTSRDLRRFAVASIPILVVGVCTIASASPRQSASEAPRRPEMPITISGGGDTGRSGCRQCHYCNAPTSENRCLFHPCQRDETGNGAADRGVASGPDLIIMDSIEGSYLPVPFDHKGHAAMAAMTEGCATCHHLTPEGQTPPPCRTCHEIGAGGTDIYKPGLKGAYHQQCMNCHRDWVDETDCSICHRTRAGLGGKPAALLEGGGDDLTGGEHPPIPEPQGEFYEGRRQEHTAGRVVFRHHEHVHRFGLHCVECHHEPSCTRCHARENGNERTVPSSEHHRPCLSCHKGDMDGASVDASCERCHWEEGRSMPARFDHGDTGWPLERYHQGKNCRACHKTVPFARLERDCHACHAGWSPTTFDHRVTGQALDELHAELDCAECHAARRFDLLPTCDECHDEESGIAFPTHRPGPLVAPGPGSEGAPPAG